MKNLSDSNKLASRALLPGFRRALTCAFIVMVSLQILASHAAAQSAGWKFAKGDQFSINLKQTSSVETVVDRRVINQNSEMTMDIQWEVAEMQGDNALVQQTITRIVSSLTIPGDEGVNTPKTIEYDSDVEKPRGDSKRMHASFSRIINQPITLTIAANGEIVEVDVPEATLESLRQMPASMQGRKMWELESIRETFSNAALKFPGDEQQEWQAKRDFSIGSPQKFSQTLDYSIADATSKPLKIDFTGKIAVVESMGSSERPEGIEFDSLEIEDQATSGQIVFDTESGNCTSSKSTTMLKTRSAYRDMQVVATINSAVDMTVERK